MTKPAGVAMISNLRGNTLADGLLGMLGGLSAPCLFSTTE